MITDADFILTIRKWHLYDQRRKEGIMTIDERQQSLTNARAAAEWLGSYTSAIIRQAIIAHSEQERAEEAHISLIEIDRAVATETAKEEEREACAKILELEAARYETGHPGPIARTVVGLLLTLAAKIRARGAEKEKE